MVKMLIRKLFRTAWSYKSQFASMIIMIAIGVGVFLGFNIEWRTIKYNTFAFMEDTNYADFRIYNEAGFTQEEIEQIEAIDGIEAATRYFNVNVDIEGTKKSIALNVSENYTVSTMLVTEGADYDSQRSGIWISDRFAEANNIEIGDEIKLTYLGMTINEKVVGLAKSGENMVCVADDNQLMPDYESFGFGYISPKNLENIIGMDYYPQINIISDLSKDKLEEKIKAATGTTFLVTTKNEHPAYAGATGEAEEGKTMGAILPVLFLAIAMLTMVTTMHRIAANEKVQIGTLKALGLRDSKILIHYTMYGLIIGIVGLGLGVALGFLIASLLVSPTGTMSTYIDIPGWKLVMPGFCIPVMIFMLAFLTLISFVSVKRMLKGTAADALRPYTPKAMKKSFLEKTSVWKKLSFGTKWNLRDIFRHKARGAMTLIGVFGCMLLLVGALGMKDTMFRFVNMLNNDVSNYETKINLTEGVDNEQAKELAKEVQGDWQANMGISYEGKTITLEIYGVDNGKIGFLTEEDEHTTLSDEGVYLCLRLKETAQIGDEIEFSPYGSDETYKVKVAGYLRSLISENIVMTDEYAKKMGIEYSINSIYTDVLSEDILEQEIISGKQDKDTIMATYDTFMEIMNIMIAVFVVAAIVLGIVVLYNLGVMSYVERYRELATLKVLGFKDAKIGNLLITQNIWLTLCGVILGLPGGVLVLNILIKALVSEYELSIYMGWMTSVVSIALTFGVSFFVGLIVSVKNKKINMVEALKGAE